jgi:PAS domain-containing protein
MLKLICVYEEERISKAFTLTGLGIWDYDVKHNSVVFNKQMFLLLGLPFEEKKFTYEEFLSIFGDSEAKIFHDSIKECYVENGSFYHEHSLFHSQSNSVVWILDRGAVVERNLIGQPTRIIGTTTDITKRKTFEIELKKSHENLKNLQIIYLVYYISFIDHSMANILSPM